MNALPTAGGAKNIELRGMAAGGLGLVVTLLYAQAPIWPVVGYGVVLTALAGAGMLVQHLPTRAVLLALAALLAAVPAAYLLVMLPPVGLILLSAPLLAGWGAVRAATGRAGAPHPLA